MPIFKKKQPQIQKQGPWLITIYSEVKNKGEEDEFDPGFIEFQHKQTNRSIKEELNWIYGRGSFKSSGPPNLINVWDMLIKHTPGMQLIVYKNWHIERDRGCFECQLADRNTHKYVLKRIISNVTCIDQDFASFIRMLDNEQKFYDGNNKPSILNLDQERQKRSKGVPKENYVDYAKK
jgi:hypothetical protein